MKLLLFALAASVSICAFPQTIAEKKTEWKLVWQDDFNGKNLNQKKWNVLMRENSKHNELQYYIPEEVFTRNGFLTIRSSRRNYGSKEYTSGRLDTKDKYAPVYGRFEIRAKLPGGQGVWPAFWLYPQNRNWLIEYIMAEAVANGKESLIPEERPWYTEIDIMEFLGHERSILYGTLHYYTFDGRKMTSSGTWRGTDDYTKDFHTYVLEWEPDSLKWYVDDHLIHSTGTGIPHTPHYIILNTAIGGAWPGNPDSTTVFPQLHEIDYVRVYQRAGKK
ncbi:MAG TPA: glycoside hydrolase family 16 protein [Bacteroidales bacterium]|nr:glycoside hydrolase family 16 protein [Bacteroidales bacterium]